MEKYIDGVECTVSYDELTPEKFSGVMGKYGCMLLRGLFSPDEVKDIRDDTLDLFYVIKNLMHNKLLSPENEQYIAGGHPAGILPSLSALEPVLNKPRLIEALQKYFNKKEFVVNVESTGIRRCDPHEWKNFLNWHQDVFTRIDTFLTCWMPLMPIDEFTPGLDLIPHKMTRKIHDDNGLEVSYSGAGMSEEELTRNVSPLRFRALMQVGDVLLFDPYCPHRTSFHENFNKERYSIDIRIHPKDCVPEETWKTNAINLPSSRTAADFKHQPKAMFNFRHLIAFNQGPVELAPAPVAAVAPAPAPAASLGGAFKKIMNRITGQ